MSCFLVSDATLGAVVDGLAHRAPALGARHTLPFLGWCVATRADAIARLRRANVRAMQCRYKSFTAAETREYLARTDPAFRNIIETGELIRRLDCLLYQLSELEPSDDDWCELSMIRDVLLRLTLSELPGYASTPWE